MFKRFLLFQWKSAIRSPMWQKNLVLNLVIGFFLFFFAIYLLLLGLLLPEILHDLFPEREPLPLFNGVLLYYFIADLLVRFLMQGLPKLNIESFLHLPVKKSSIIHYMGGRTVFDVFNLIPMLVFIPATFRLVLPEAGPLPAFAWITCMVLMVLANNFVVIWLKRMLGTKPLIVGIIAILFAGLVVLDRGGILSLTGASSAFFGFVAEHPITLVIPLLWFFFTYSLHYHFLRLHLYPDEVQQRRTVEYDPADTSRYLRSLGLTGTIIGLELKLYWRNKRTRTTIYLFPIFILYGFFFYPQPEYLNQNTFLMFVGVFMTGGMMLNYTNYAFAYESTYFDALLSKNIDFRQYIRVKYIFALLICVVCYILTIPYVYFGHKILLINTAMFLYNIGVLAFVLLYFATYNKQRFELTRGGAFNYQGIGAMNFLAVIPAFLLPIILYMPFKISGYPDAGIAITGLLGIAGLLCSKSMLAAITRNFYSRKHIMASSFRQKS